MEALIQNIQASRNKAMPTLYLGGLQMNTDQYFMPNDLNNQEFVPEPPKKIFGNYGATVEIDRREFAIVQPQVPRNPEQEALNEYFSQQRIRQFAKGQANFLIQEQLNKQAELIANQVVRDEIDRRSGIRRAVLEATGLTPAQIQIQMANEGLAGINPKLIDIRDRQIQDAVNLYYNQHNIPVPVTTPFEPSTNIAPTVPAEARVGLPFNEAEAGFIEDQALLKNPEDADLPEEVELPVPNISSRMTTTTTTSDPRSRPYTGSVANPYTIGGNYNPATVEMVEAMTLNELAEFIEVNYIIDDPPDNPSISTMNQKTNELKSLSSIRALGKPRLVQIVLKWMSENEGNTNISSGSSSLQKY